ncbi:hypothetical protein JTE90_015445 [Oedothorax gibbosus]|uniref:Uncharacterized protein n=1 Tax=Oedothorax gibbosus TaxID=931172 RepID=A0AAV6TGU9_9ARAC|nr:hypothetical protein JTE90_015445 [Oedothorax gibbosus]
MGRAPDLATPRSRGLAAESVLRQAHLLNATFPHGPCERGISTLGFLPVHGRRTKESRLVSFPPLDLYAYIQRLSRLILRST